MKNILIIFLTITAFTVSVNSQSETLPEVKTSDAFKQLQGFIGKWEGELTKYNGEVESIETEFSLIANGSVIVERFTEGGAEAFTMYHDKNGQLTATHYCALGNAPSFTLSKKDKYNLSFAFDPLCGLKVGKDKFLHSLVWNYDPKKPNKLQSYSKIIDTDKSKGANTKKLTRVK